MQPDELRNQLWSRLSPERAREDIGWLSEREPARTLRASVNGFLRHNDTLWASALTYTSSLSLVPILALALSVLTGLGGIKAIRPLIERYLAANSPEIADKLLTYVGNVSSRALGEVGGAVLLVTVVLTLGTVEQALNNIFNVSHGRSWLRKFSDYLSVTFTVPLLLVAAVPVNRFLINRLPHLPGAGWGASTMMVWAGFFFLYVFFPYTEVKWRAALIGSLVAAILLQAGQWGYVYFQVGVANYHAIYGALASVPILLTWIYLAWVIVLYGAELTAAIQGNEPAFELDYHTPGFVRTAALLAVIRAGERMKIPDKPPCTLHQIALEMGVGESALQPVVDRLKAAEIIIEATGGRVAGDRGGPKLFLGRDARAITIAEVMTSLEPKPSDRKRASKIASILEGLTAAENEMLGSVSVDDLISDRALQWPHVVQRNGDDSKA